MLLETMKKVLTAVGVYLCMRGLLQLWGQRWCCLGERLARHALCCTGAGCKTLERP